MNRKVGLWIGIVFAVVFLAVLTTSMMSLRKHRVEVCMSWNGRSECKVASGASQQEAQRTATDQACALLAAGMTDSMNCSNSQPASLRWLD